MSSFSIRWREIASSFLRIGVLAYGGPAIMGIMQAELQERRGWVDKQRFVEGLALVNLLPGAGATQLAIFLGYARGGWWGGLLAGLCFVLPAFIIMLVLAASYAALSAMPLMRGALYGLGPVVLALFAVAVYRLGRNAIVDRAQFVLAVAAALAMATGFLGVVSVLTLAGGVGIFLFASRRQGLAVLAGIVLLWLLTASLAPLLDAKVGGGATSAGIADIAAFFAKVGAFTFGGGLTMIALVQEQVVVQYQWLTPREFIDGLALGQFVPGPILMVAAYVGFKLAGFAGAIVGAAAIFLPSFVLMLGLLPIFDRVRNIAWMKAAMRGIGPAVIGVLTVSLTQLAPHAAPDALAWAMFAPAVALLLAWRVGAIKLMLGGAALGMLRERLG